MAIACLIFDSISFREEYIYRSYHLTMHRQACSAMSMRGLWRGYGRMTVMMCTLLMTTSNSAWLLQFCYNTWCPVTDMDNLRCRIRVWTLTTIPFTSQLTKWTAKHQENHSPRERTRTYPYRMTSTKLQALIVPRVARSPRRTQRARSTNMQFPEASQQARRRLAPAHLRLMQKGQLASNSQVSHTCN